MAREDPQTILPSSFGTKSYIFLQLFPLSKVKAWGGVVVGGNREVLSSEHSFV